MPSDKIRVNSRNIRDVNAETDALHLGMGWDHEELSLPNIIIESTYGESHPGSSHLLRLSNWVRDGVLSAGGKPSIFISTDICDGVAQGGSGMGYSLLSRDFISFMVEIHVKASLCDGLVLLSSCDKSVPGHILSTTRVDCPCILVPGGCMSSGADFLSVDQLWELKRNLDAGRISRQFYEYCQANACPSEGACQPMGTAGTMQVISEALGLSLPWSALIPATNNAMARSAKKAGKGILKLINRGIKPKDILNKAAFENAITLHAATGGSTNAVMHILAAAKELDLDIDLDTFQKIHEKTPYITNILNTGRYPTEYLWYAGGVPAVMVEIEDLLHLDVLTVTGDTLGDNLRMWKEFSGSLAQCNFLKNCNIDPSEIIKNKSRPINKDGGIVILKGNIAREGAIIKHSALSDDMFYFIGRARVFDSEQGAMTAFENKDIRSGDVVVITNQGPRACGMPEMFRISDMIEHYDYKNVAVITDGRFSGCSGGPAIGYVSPEAFDGGTVGFLEEGDLIEIDVQRRSLNFVIGNVNGDLVNGLEILEQRRAAKPKNIKIKEKGVMGLYRQLASSVVEGGRMKLG